LTRGVFGFNSFEKCYEIKIYLNLINLPSTTKPVSIIFLKRVMSMLPPDRMTAIFLFLNSNFLDNKAANAAAPAPSTSVLSS
jgi:hypothetical protein